MLPLGYRFEYSSACNWFFFVLLDVVLNCEGLCWPGRYIDRERIGGG
jgi:hypothetical protein